MSKRMSYATLALGSLRARKRQYRSMALGIVFAIFFVSLLLQLGQSVFFSMRAAHWQKNGLQDAVLYDAEDVSRERLLADGYVTRVGDIYILGEIGDTGCSIANYDDAGFDMSGRRCTEGRMPQAPGEIAVEPLVLSKLRGDFKIGDEISFALKVPTGKNQFLPETVRKTYVLTGLLYTQSVHQRDGWYSDFSYLEYPSAVVSEQERVEPGGRAIVHRLLMVAPGIREEALIRYAQKLDGNHVRDFRFFFLYEGDTLIPGFAGALGVALVLAACTGIVNAFASNLSERRAQIGMLRAVGATARQIRAIYVREALLLALLLSPAALALSCGAARLIVRALGAGMAFYMEWWYLPVALAVSLAVVFSAAMVPLWGASRVSPMQALRDTALLRAQKRIRIKTQTEYRVPRMLAKRNIQLYRTRQAGVAAFIAISFLLILLASWIFASMAARVPETYAYEMSNYRDDQAFVDTPLLWRDGFTDGDLAELRALPLVDEVNAVKVIGINLLLERVTQYYAESRWSGSYWTPPLPEQNVSSWERELYQKEYADLRDQQRIASEIAPVTMVGCDERVMALLKDHVLEGHIDIDALNAGREVLMIAPSTRYSLYVVDGNGGVSTQQSTRAGELREPTYVFENDMFRAGDVLPICRLYADAPVQRQREDESFDFLTGIRRTDATTKIGALLDAESARIVSRGLWGIGYAGDVITTFSGMNALGMNSGTYCSVGVHLADTPDSATEEYLERTIESISLRAQEAGFGSNLASARDEMRNELTMLVCIASITVLLFAMCASMLGNAITNRVRSDRRAIGTLRAVGAPLRDIVSSYWQQIAYMLAGGAVAGILFSIGYMVWYTILNPYYSLASSAYFWLFIPIDFAYLALMALLCGLQINRHIRIVARASIVDNIREL